MSTKKPTVIDHDFSQKGQRLILRLFIPETLRFFQGHFPEAPILPGIVQADWAIHFAHQFFKLPKESMCNIQQLKFTKIITPNSTISLSLQIANDILLFKYFHENTVYASGKIKVSTQLS